METSESTVLNQTIQLKGKRKDGNIFPLEINIAESKVDNQVYFTAAVKDITERVRMKQELIQSRDKLEIRVQERTKDLQNAQQELSDTIQELKRSNSELEQFAYVVSHDLQEPLRVIGNYSKLLPKKLSGIINDDAQEFLTFINDGVSRMNQLIKDLLSYSRVGKANSNFKPTNLNHLILLAKNNLKTQIEVNQTQITSDELPILTVDKTLMTQLFQNLIGNAIKYRSERNPIINIRVEEQEKCWKFSIQDNGTGIETSYLNKIFVAFQRATDKDIDGSGIGLAVCQKIIDLHKGKLWVESTIGHGSTFYFTLPKKV
jgi:light-regulated signal transduction histidine kinase (bacteriophytochrome)